MLKTDLALQKCPIILIGAKYASTLFENKVLNLALSKVDEMYYTEKGSPTVKLSPTEIKRALGVRGNSVYDTLNPLAKTLVGRVMGITDPENHYFHYVSVVTDAEYENGYLSISFNRELEDNIFRLKKHYTLMSLEMIMKFSSN